MRLLPIIHSAAFALFLVLIPPAYAAPQPGKTLHDQFCLSCHQTSQYAPNKRKIQDYPGLVKRVKGCSVAAGSSWSPAELQQVVDYLNQSYYHFQ